MYGAASHLTQLLVMCDSVQTNLAQEKMKLVGMLDSPYIRRTAISLSYLGVPFAHQAVSVFGNLEIDIARTNWVSLREQVSQAEITAATFRWPRPLLAQATSHLSGFIMKSAAKRLSVPRAISGSGAH